MNLHWAVCKNARSLLPWVSASGACCDNGRYFLLTAVNYRVHTLLLGSDFDTFEGPVAFIFLHHLLMCYLTTFSSG